MQLDQIKQLTCPLVLALFLAVAGKGYSQSFHLKGTTKGNDGKWIYLYYPDQDGNRRTDSVLIKNNAYHFSGTVAGPAMVYMGIKGKDGRLSNENGYRFFLEPRNLQARQEGEYIKNSRVRGSETQDQYQPLVDQQERLDQQWQVVMDTLQNVNKRSNTEYQELKNWVLLPYVEQREGMEKSFFRAHPQSAVTAYLLRFYVSKMKIDSLEKYYNALGSKLQASISGQELAKEIAKIKRGSPGSIATDFQATDINGKSLQLSAFKGKYVLLDFWASWCVPCRASNPHMKELYHRYHDKGLEIIGVSDDDFAPEKWKAAVTKDGVGIWHNVLRGYDKSLAPGAENPKDISGKFGIHVLPTKILIDPNGKIIGRFTGTDDEVSLDAALVKAFESD